MLYIGLQIRRQGPDVRVQEQDQRQGSGYRAGYNAVHRQMHRPGCRQQTADRGTGPDTDDRTIA